MPASDGTSLVPVVITALLGGGGAVFLGALIKGWADLRAGARARERETVTDLAAARDDAETRRSSAERDRDYWRSIAGRYGYQLRQAGVKPDPETPEPPSDKERTRELRDPRRGRRSRGHPLPQEGPP